jgi:hypothetical protein
MLAWLGVAFVVMGVFDVLLGIYPLSFGNVEWEFGVISSILNGFAIPTMGSYLFVSSSLALGRRLAARIAAIAMILVALALVGLGLFYAIAAPIALRAVSQNDVLYLGMKKAVAKAILFLVMYLVLYIAGAMWGWKASKT